jgi:LPXTG-motif cell wall-anchored protein
MVTNVLLRGAFTIEKVVAGDGAPDISFGGTWGCAVGATQVGQGEWSLSAGETSDPIEAPVGATCTVVETPPAASAEGSWEPAVIAPDTVLITPTSVQAPLGVVVTNTFTATPVLGGFDIVKVVEGADGIAFTDSFTGAWSCTAEGSEVAGGTWTATSTEPYAVDDVAVGAECTVTEQTPADPAGGSWGTATISPATFVVADAGTRVEVTVTNVLTADPTPDPGPGPGPEGGGELPATGTTVPWWAIAVGGVLLVGGAAVVVVAMVRRRRS